MKRFLPFLVTLLFPVFAFAQFTVPQGGTGTTTVPTNWVVIGKSALHLTAVATSSLGLVNSVSNVDGTLTVSPTTGAVIASINLAHANIWTALQTFSNASTSLLTVSGTQWITSLGTPAGTFLAVDPTGKVIATTTTPTGVTAVTGTYPITSTGGATPNIAIAFGTTTANSWSALQTFANSSTTLATINNLWTGLTAFNLLATDANGKMVATSTISTGFLTGNLGTINTTAPLGGGGAFNIGTTLTLTCATCNTFSSSTNPLMATYFVATSTTQASTFPLASTTLLTVSTNQWLTALAAAGGSFLAVDNTGKIIATTSPQAALSFPLTIAQGGTATSTQVTNGVNFFDGTRITSGTQLAFNGTNLSIGTTTFGSLLNLGGIANFTTATSTFYSSGGINLAAGCFAIAGNCLVTGTGALGAGTTGQNAYYSALNTVTGTSSLFTANNSFIGIGTTSPDSLLTINAGTTNVVAAAIAGTNLHMIGKDATGNVFQMDSFGAANSMILRRADGTGALPTALVTNDAIANIIARGYDGTAYSAANSTAIASVAAETWTTAAHGAFIRFNTTAIGSTAAAAERMRITDAGFVGIGNAGPANMLDVFGFINTDATAGGYKMGNALLLYASSTNASLGLGFGAGGTWITSTSSVFTNVAIGRNAMLTTLTSGTATDNVAIGDSVLQSNTKGQKNMAIGSSALNANTTGNNNVALGYISMIANQTGVNNVGVGSQSLQNVTNNSNTAIGQASMTALTSGSDNTAIGLQSGYGDGTTNRQSTVDTNSTFLGYFSSRASNIAQSTVLDNATAVGYNAQVGCSNCLVLGASANVGIGTTTPTAELEVAKAGFTDFAIKSTAAANLARLQMYANGTSWYVDNRGTLDATNNRLAFSDTNGSERVTFTQAGLVGIGTSTPWRTLSVVGTAAMPNLTTSAGLQTGVVCVSAQGELINDSVACIASAARYKDNIQPLKVGLAEVLRLNPISFVWKKAYNGALQSDPNKNGIQYSLLADQVQKVDPLLVSVTTATTTFEGKTYAPGTVEGLADTNHWVGLFVSAFHDVAGQLQGILARLDGDEKKINDLEVRLTALEAKVK